MVYKIAIQARGATPVVAPEKDLRTDVDAILARVTPKTKMVFLANPNNPTGTYIPFDEVRRLHAGLPANVLPVIRDAQKAGATTLRAVAAALNARGISTARGGAWHAMSVKNVLDRQPAPQARQGQR